MNGLLIAGTLFAGLYCYVLAGRVRALKSLDSGLGGSIVTLTRQIELARATLDEARAGARETRQDLGQLTARADAAAAQLRLLLAAIETSGPVAPAPAAEPAAPPAAPLSGTAPTPTPLAESGGLAARRREAPGPRLVPPPEPEPEAPASIFALDALEPSLPKPRRSLSLDAMLRRRGPPQPNAAPQTEADLIAALSALASGGER